MPASQHRTTQPQPHRPPLSEFLLGLAGDRGGSVQLSEQGARKVQEGLRRPLNCSETSLAAICACPLTSTSPRGLFCRLSQILRVERRAVRRRGSVLPLRRSLIWARRCCKLRTEQFEVRCHVCVSQNEPAQRRASCARSPRTEDPLCGPRDYHARTSSYVATMCGKGAGATRSCHDEDIIATRS